MKSLKSYLSWFDFSIFFKYAGANLIFQITTMVAEFLILKLVLVEEIGMWQFALLIQGYVVISRLGIINAFNRDYPFLRSEENYEKAEKVLRTTAFHVRMSMILQALTFAGISLFYGLKGDTYLSITLGVMVLYTVLEASANFEEAKLRGELLFDKISKAKILGTLVTLTSLLLPYYLGFEGLLARVILIRAFFVLFYKLSATTRYKTKLFKDQWFDLFKDGWKLWLWSYLKSVNASIPRLFLVSFASITVLGLFTPVNWMLLSLTLFTASLNSYLYPNFSQRFAKGDSDLPKKSLFINLMTFAGAIPMVGLIYLIIPFLIGNYLPEYSEAIAPMRITIIASLFDIFNVSSTVWVSMKDWSRMFWFIGVSLTIKLVSMAYVYFNITEVLLNLSIAILISSIATAVVAVIMLLTQNKKLSNRLATA